jgi:undecaprenyl-diphosphatase
MFQLNLLDAIILGIVQGVTEFLPVSSSGHLQLVQHFLGLTNLNRYILFDLACHLGTLLAILIVFHRRILDLFRGPKTALLQVMVGTLPLFPLVLVLKPIKAAYDDPSYLGYFFLITAAILFLGNAIGNRVAKMDPSRRPWKDSFIIGLWQAIAILPGVSRSGSTISGARILGWDMQQAIAFSFLLAIPAILGATVLEGYKIYQQGDAIQGIPFVSYFTGFMISFIVGLGSLHLLIKMALAKKFFYFAWYCAILGLITTVYFHY